MRGQMDIFDFLEYDQEPDERKERWTYATPCGGCQCNECANNVDGQGKPEEMKFACFNCDDCYHYGHDPGTKDNYKPTCDAFLITNISAERARRRMHIVH